MPFRKRFILLIFHSFAIWNFIFHICCLIHIWSFSFRPFYAIFRLDENCNRKNISADLFICAYFPFLNGTHYANNKRCFTTHNHFINRWVWKIRRWNRKYWYGWKNSRKNFTQTHISTHIPFLGQEASTHTDVKGKLI